MAAKGGHIDFMFLVQSQKYVSFEFPQPTLWYLISEISDIFAKTFSPFNLWFDKIVKVFITNDIQIDIANGM